MPHETPFGDQRDIRGTELQDRPLLPSRRRLGSFTVGVAVVSAIIVVISIAILGRSVNRSLLTISTVERGLFVRDVLSEGKVVASISPTLYAPASGVLNLLVHPGDSVKKAQVLGVIENPELIAKLAQERANAENVRLEQGRVRLDGERKLAQFTTAYKQAMLAESTAERELIRDRKAFEAGAYPELLVLRAEDDLKKAGMDSELARGNVELQIKQNQFDADSQRTFVIRQNSVITDLEREVDALRIRSPLDGVVGQVLVADRASVSNDMAIFNVVDLSKLEVQMRVPESLARDLAPGMSAVLQGNGEEWQGTIYRVSPEVVNGEVTAQIHFSGAVPEGLRQNQRVSVRIIIDRQENVLLVDRGSLVRQQRQDSVYVVEGRIAKKRQVRFGLSSVRKIQVIEGLQAGEQIVTAGDEVFRGQAQVKISN
ncbi:MAG: efflux RND transporter periplasmic adaptor subunit [Steroidobacteraceae bacterium]